MGYHHTHRSRHSFLDIPADKEKMEGFYRCIRSGAETADPFPYGAGHMDHVLSVVLSDRLSDPGMGHRTQSGRKKAGNEGLKESGISDKIIRLYPG